MQIRVARAMLNMSMTQLHNASGLHRNTLSNVEKEGAEIRPATANLLQKIFEENGIKFSEPTTTDPGVRFTYRKPRDGQMAIFDEM